MVAPGLQADSRLQQERARVALVADRAAADLDPLTGLHTRRALERQLAAVLARREPAVDLLVVFLDLDRFRQINDVRSHLVGDLTLHHVGEAVRRRLRGDDFAARLGGDEFVLVLSGQTLPQAREMLRLLQQEIGEFAVGHPDIGLPLTFTAGITTVDEVTVVRDVLHRADLAMLAGGPPSRR